MVRLRHPAQEGCFAVNLPVINTGKSIVCRDLTIDEAACRALVERVSQHALFGRSARLRDLLVYVADRSLSGRAEELTESEIGVHVFGRPEGFNPGDDSIVRVTARQLRARLAEYFDTDGRSEALVVQVPKGSYVAQFSVREKEIGLAEPPEENRRKGPRGLILGLAGVAVLSSCAAGWLFYDRVQVAGRAPEMTLARYLLMSAPQRTAVVVADSGLVIAQKVTQEAPGIEQYTSGQYLRRMDEEFARHGITELAKHLHLTQHTGMADAVVYGRILRTNPDKLDRIVLRHARGVSGRDFQMENAILIGGPGTNPWARVFVPRMNFVLGYDAAMQTTYLMNRKPQAGEPARYDSPGDSDVGFGHVVLLGNTAGKGLVLLVSGTKMESKEAAGEYITDGAAYRNLLGLIGRSTLDGVGRLEVLLRAKRLAGSSQEWRVIAHRVGE